MTAYMTRSAMEYWGHNPAPDIAGCEIDHRGRRLITWSDVMRHRREQMEWSLRHKRECAEWRAYKVWVAYFDMFIMGGWQAFIDRGREREWIDRDRRRLKPHLMRLFPLVLPLGSEGEQWSVWKQQFAKQFQRRRQDRRPLGVAYVLWDGKSQPTITDHCRRLMRQERKAGRG